MTVPSSLKELRAALIPSELPLEVVGLLCSYFTGFDAFNLSLTNVWWRNYLSDESFWRKCLCGSLSNEDQRVENQFWKKMYVQSRSIVFKSLEPDRDSYAYFTRTEDQRDSYFQLTHMGGESFSFDIWFSLVPAESVGGIIYGLQSSSRESCQRPHLYQQYVAVSSTGDLYCSLIQDNTAVANNLEPNRWYHVALTYDHHEQRQNVFFNGAKVQSKVGSWRYNWHFMTFGQIGTGWSEVNKKWDGFHGVIDQFRAWKGVLTQEEITNLSTGVVLSSAKLQVCLKHKEPSSGSAKHVKCTRPTEATRMQLIN
ncbi:hypothetical protein DVH05_002561 [Phytophthora capsici]|nr:hypothetical protein DVH05_002561 [Phytophthora capsici]